MSNNLGKLRKEFKMTQNDLAEVLNVSSTNVGYYEQEKRDFSTKLLLKLSDMFQASIDYILCNSTNGIFVYYDGYTPKKYDISEEMLDTFIEKGVIYYKDDSYKRYISINKLLGLQEGYDLSNLMDEIDDLNLLFSLLPNLPLANKDDLDKLYIHNKILDMDMNKAHAIKKLLEYL